MTFNLIIPIKNVILYCFAKFSNYSCNVSIYAVLHLIFQSFNSPCSFQGCISIPNPKVNHLFVSKAIKIPGMWTAQLGGPTHFWK